MPSELERLLHKKVKDNHSKSLSYWLFLWKSGHITHSKFNIEYQRLFEVERDHLTAAEREVAQEREATRVYLERAGIDSIDPHELNPGAAV